jgi:hypothetical protein
VDIHKVPVVVAGNKAVEVVHNLHKVACHCCSKTWKEACGINKYCAISQNFKTRCDYWKRSGSEINAFRKRTNIFASQFIMIKQVTLAPSFFTREAIAFLFPIGWS